MKKTYKKVTTYRVDGMDCASCAMVIEGELEDIGIACKCSYAKQILEVEGEHDEKKVREAVKKAGYNLS